MTATIRLGKINNLLGHFVYIILVKTFAGAVRRSETDEGRVVSFRQITKT